MGKTVKKFEPRQRSEKEQLGGRLERRRERHLKTLLLRTMVQKAELELEESEEWR